ncbi:MAG: type III secretion system export apparatus subunit SctS [Deltaproteobacteria bacterium]|nr:type III secretion system export apparatus subunit SctS [Deltaproteobacteria bacterium]
MVRDFIVQITNEGVLLVLVLCGPTLLVSMFVGLSIALFSATTQIQEQTLSFVPKMIAVFAVLAATGPWVGATMLRYAQRCLGGFVDVVN